MAEKVACDACGKEVGVASTWSRVGFLPGSMLNRVCGSCYKDKLRSDDRRRFTKGKAVKRKVARRRTGASGVDEDAQDDSGMGFDPHRAPDELRF